MPKEKPVAVYGAIISNLLIAILKYIVAFLTHSSAMLAEGEVGQIFIEIDRLKE